MILSINQPAYLPWLGYFHRIAVSDRHVVLDHVQFEKNSFVNRNRIRTPDGWCWLTVPVKTKGRFGALPITKLEIDNAGDWRGRHWKAMAQNYARAPHFPAHAPFFESVYRADWVFLADLCSTITGYLLKSLGIATPLESSTRMPVGGAKDELVLGLCRAVGADVYLSGPLGRDYIREPLFDAAGIKVVYQEYRHPRYTQCQRDGFVPNLSAVDLLFNHGTESRAILMSNQEPMQR